MTNPVYRLTGGANNPAAAIPVSGSRPSTSSTSTSGCTGRQFAEFDGTSFTLSGTNSGGAAANIKMQSADDVVESVLGLGVMIILVVIFLTVLKK